MFVYWYFEFALKAIQILPYETFRPLVTSSESRKMVNKFGKITIRGTIMFLIMLSFHILVVVQNGINIRDNFFTGKTVTSTRDNKI